MSSEYNCQLLSSRPSMPAASTPTEVIQSFNCSALTVWAIAKSSSCDTKNVQERPVLYQRTGQGRRENRDFLEYLQAMIDDYPSMSKWDLIVTLHGPTRTNTKCRRWGPPDAKATCWRSGTSLPTPWKPGESRDAACFWRLWGMLL